MVVVVRLEGPYAGTRGRFTAWQVAPQAVNTSLITATAVRPPSARRRPLTARALAAWDAGPASITPGVIGTAIPARLGLNDTSTKRATRRRLSVRLIAAMGGIAPTPREARLRGGPLASVAQVRVSLTEVSITRRGRGTRRLTIAVATRIAH